MYRVPLALLPNQSVSFNVDGAYWQLKLYQAANQMCADVKRNGTDIILGVRCYSGIPLMPYPHMDQPTFGNFVFDADVDWTDFESKCQLFYLTRAEFAAFQLMLVEGV